MSDSTLRPGADFDPHRSRWIPWAFAGGMGVVAILER
jgi:hypothetical protein